MKPIIAIDGPAASGKGTMARMLAEHFGFAYLDSGSLYRAFACVELVLADKPSALIGEGALPDESVIPDSCEDYDFLHTLSDVVKTFEKEKRNADFSSIISHDKISMDVVPSAKGLVRFANEIPANILKSEIVGMGASLLGKLPEVRTLLTSLMREFAESPGNKYLGTVMDGRDIGTVVFPNATCKIFLTADLKVRAERRYKDIVEAGSKNETPESIYAALKSRDERDASRGIAPMTCDESYIKVDTTNDDINEVFNKLVNIVDARLHNN